MSGPEYLCELLWPLLAHRGKKPMPPDAILNRAAVPVEDLGKARHELDDLAELPFVNKTNRGLQINTGMQEQIADFLYYRCDYRKDQIKMRLKHYDDWDRHEWAPSYW